MTDLEPKNSSRDLRSFFSSNEWIFYLVVVAAGLFMRWLELDLRPVHHDESQHGMFGKYFFDFPDYNYYRYQPMLHGPLLYNLYRLVYNTFDSTLWSFRVPIAFLGSLYMFLPLVFRRYFSPVAVLFLTVGMALGPSVIFWSRFAREDFYTIFAMLLMLWAATLSPARWKGAFFIFGLVLQFCSKENVFVHIAVLLGWLVFESLFGYCRAAIARRSWTDIAFHGAISMVAIGVALFSIRQLAGMSAPRTESSIIFIIALLISFAVVLTQLCLVYSAAEPDNMLRRIGAQVRRYPYETAIGFAVAAFVYCYLFSAGFRHAEGIIDGLGREGIAYWSEHHGMERIKGPFLHQFYVLAWYELPFILFYFGHLVHFYLRGGRTLNMIGVVLIATAFVAAVPFWFFEVDVEKFGLTKFFKAKDFRDVIGVVVLLFHPLVVTVTHLIRRERALAAFGYLFTSFFFTYCYLGEKVPWLSMYPLFTGLIYLTLYFDRAWADWLNREYRWEWRNFLYLTGGISMVLGLIFIFEEFGNSEFFPLLHENEIFLGLGAGLVLLGFLDRFRPVLGTFNMRWFALVVIALFNFRLAIITNFTRPGEASEYISQVHTTPEFHRLILALRSEMLASTRGKKPWLLGRGESTWPVTWYMVGVENYNFDIPQGKTIQDYDYVFDTWDNDDTLNKVPPGFTGRRIDFRGWWVPDFNQITLKKFLRYAINHVPWNSTGFTYLLYMSKDK